MRNASIIFVALFLNARSDDQYELKTKLKSGEKLVASYKGEFITEEKEVQSGKEDKLIERNSLVMDLKSDWNIQKIADNHEITFEEKGTEAFITWEFSNGSFVLEFKDDKFVKDEFKGDESVRKQKDELKQGIIDRKTVAKKLAPDGAVMEADSKEASSYNVPGFLPGSAIKVGDRWEGSDGKMRFTFTLVKIEKKGDMQFALIRGECKRSEKTVEIDSTVERTVELSFCIDEGMLASFKESYKEMTARLMNGITQRQHVTGKIEMLLRRA